MGNQLAYLRKILREALTFYCYLKNSNKRWHFKSKQTGEYPRGYNPAKHSKSAVTAEAKQDALYWLKKYNELKSQV